MNLLQRVLRVLGIVRALWPFGWPDVLILVGIGCLVHGTSLIWPPLAWIIAGLLIGLIGAFSAYGERKRGRP